MTFQPPVKTLRPKLTDVFSRAVVSSWNQRTSLLHTLPLKCLEDILSHVITNATFDTLDELNSTKLPRLYVLNMSGDLKLLLAIAPSRRTRLLRHESAMLSSEAALIRYIKNMSDRGRSVGSSRDGQQKSLETLCDLVPKLLKHSSSTWDLANPYSIFEIVSGTVISKLDHPLSRSERQIVDRKVGRLARSLANFVSPANKFGMAGHVLSSDFRSDLPSVQSMSRGSSTWSEGFNIMLESILRDGEDMAVLLPYESIRAHFERLAWRLDTVTIPRLVILDVNCDENVMVERRQLEDDSKTIDDIIEVTGFRCWDQGVFGDPLLASCFDQQSDDFLAGWADGGQDIIEEHHGTYARLLLYRCYRAIVCIVKEHYRPRDGSSSRELDGRRALTNTLTELDGIYFDLGCHSTERQSTENARLSA